MAPRRVLPAMAQAFVGHLDPQFIEMMSQIQVFETRVPMTIPISGTGSAGMDAALCSLIEAGNLFLVCVNSCFGGRMGEMANRCGAE